MKKGVIVMGMHRSGTSLITKIINMMGCTLGSEEKLIKADQYNLKGYWENLDMVNLNDKLLYSIQCSWWKVSTIDIYRASTEVKKDFLEEFKKIIETFDNTYPWVIKDPRLVLTFPLWKEYADNFHFVFVSRDPLEIALSLHNRNNMPLYLGLVLWEFYTLKYAQILSKAPFTLVKYNDLLNNPTDSVTNLYNSLCQNVFDIKVPDFIELNGFIDNFLYHYKTNNEIKKLYFTQHLCDIENNVRNGDFKSVVDMVSVDRIEELHQILRIYEEFVVKFDFEFKQ